LLKKIKKVFVIAEIGINHNGDINQAFKLIKSAARAKADAVKFQTYITEKRSKKRSPIFNILKSCELPFSSFKKLKDYAESLNLFFFSTGFDEESIVYLLEDLNTDLIKIASFDSTNNDLIKSILKYNVDIIMSLGLTNIDEVDSIIKKISKKRNLALMHCITSYPMNEFDANLSGIHLLKSKYNNIIGYSDHSNGIKIPILAVAAGAKIIEKHYMINQSDKCVDKAVSITETQFNNMVKEIRKTEKILGIKKIYVRPIEKKFLFLKRKKLN